MDVLSGLCYVREIKFPPVTEGEEEQQAATEQNLLPGAPAQIELPLNVTVQRAMLDPDGGLCLAAVRLSGPIAPVPIRRDVSEFSSVRKGPSSGLSRVL